MVVLQILRLSILVPRSLARSSLLCWISSGKILLSMHLNTTCVFIPNPYHLLILSIVLRYKPIHQFTTMASISASPPEDGSVKKEDLEFIHLEEQELAHRSPGNGSSVYSIDEAHQKRVMCVLLHSNMVNKPTLMFRLVDALISASSQFLVSCIPYPLLIGPTLVLHL